jgi:hypothetical protein
MDAVGGDTGTAAEINYFNLYLSFEHRYPVHQNAPGRLLPADASNLPVLFFL